MLYTGDILLLAHGRSASASVSFPTMVVSSPSLGVEDSHSPCRRRNGRLRSTSYLKLFSALVAAFLLFCGPLSTSALFYPLTWLLFSILDVLLHPRCPPELKANHAPSIASLGVGVPSTTALDLSSGPCRLKQRLLLLSVVSRLCAPTWASPCHHMRTGPS